MKFKSADCQPSIYAWNCDNTNGSAVSPIQFMCIGGIGYIGGIGCIGCIGGIGYIGGIGCIGCIGCIEGIGHIEVSH